MRVAIVNDLSLAREVLRRLVLSVPGNTVAWVAADGTEAVEKAAADRPDVILMDLVMPRLDGVEATRRIMKESPCPVLVVTATIPGHYELVIQAMGAGALDAVETPVLGPGATVQNGEKLLARLERLATARAMLTAPSLPVSHQTGTSSTDLPLLVVIGASTGGPAALAAVLSAFPANFPAAVLIAQHLGVDFVPGLVQQLAVRTPLPTRIARDGDRPTAGTVLIAASNDHLEVAPDRTLRYTPHPRSCPHRPSVNVLFSSAAACWPRLGVGVLLTGMDTDGADGLLQLHSLGWHTIAQNEETCVVYGMPKAAVEKRAATEILPLSQIGPSIAAKILTTHKR
jgi:two-component system response regulator WspF